MGNENKSITIFLLLLFLIGCGVADGGRVSVAQVLDKDPDADILQYENRIFSNMTDVESFQTQKNDYDKYNLLGEIKLKTNESKDFDSLVASKLPVGTRVYSTAEKYFGVLIVEYEDRILYYMELLEG